MEQLKFGLEYEIFHGPDRAELFANQIGDDQHRRAISFGISLKTRQRINGKIVGLRPKRPHSRLFQLDTITRTASERDIDEGHNWLIRGTDISAPSVRIYGHYITIDDIYWVGVEARLGKKTKRGWLRRMYPRLCKRCSLRGYFREEEIFCARCGTLRELVEDF